MAFTLSNKSYDQARFLVQIVLPALAVLYSSMAALWGFPKVQEVIGSISALALFLGAILRISSKNYEGPEPVGPQQVPVGEFVVTQLPDERVTVDLRLDQDPSGFIDGDQIVFNLVKDKVQPPEDPTLEYPEEDGREENLH